jgi:hypothetical protein
VVFLAHQKLRQRDAHVEGTSAVRVAVLQALLFSLFVSQALIGFGNDDELGAGLRVVRVAVRMVEQSQFAVGLLDLLNGSVRVHPQDLVGVETLDLVLRGQDGAGADDQSVEDCSQEQDLSRLMGTLRTNLKVRKLSRLSFLNLAILSLNCLFFSSSGRVGMWLKGLLMVLRIDQPRGTPTRISTVV